MIVVRFEVAHPRLSTRVAKTVIKSRGQDNRCPNRDFNPNFPDAGQEVFLKYVEHFTSTGSEMKPRTEKPRI
jgi:hypothetical protein